MEWKITCFTENDIVNEHGNYVAGFVAKNEETITGYQATRNVIGFVGEAYANSTIKNCTCKSVHIKKAKQQLNEKIFITKSNKS